MPKVGKMRFPYTPAGKSKAAQVSQEIAKGKKGHYGNPKGPKKKVPRGKKQF